MIIENNIKYRILALFELLLFESIQERFQICIEIILCIAVFIVDFVPNPT